MDSAVDKFLDVIAQGKLHYIERVQMRCPLGLGSWYATDVMQSFCSPNHPTCNKVWCCGLVQCVVKGPQTTSLYTVI